MHLKHTGEHRPGKTAHEMYFRERTPQNLDSWLTCQRPGREGWARILITSPAAVHAAAVTHFRLFLSNWDSQQTLYLQRKVTLFFFIKILLDLERMIYNPETTDSEVTRSHLQHLWRTMSVFTMNMWGAGSEVTRSHQWRQCLCSLWTCEELWILCFQFWTTYNNASMW